MSPTPDWTRYLCIINELNLFNYTMFTVIRDKHASVRYSDCTIIGSWFPERCIGYKVYIIRTPQCSLHTRLAQIWWILWFDCRQTSTFTSFLCLLLATYNKLSSPIWFTSVCLFETLLTERNGPGTTLHVAQILRRIFNNHLNERWIYFYIEV